jgi:hypothetical protein
MDELTRAKKNISTIKTKLKAAKKRLHVAEQNGSEAKIALCQKHVTGWEEKLQAANEDLKRIKNEQGHSKFKRFASYTGLVLTIVALTTVGATLFGKKKNTDINGEMATDSV